MPLICQWNQYCVPTWSQDTLLRKLQCADAWQGDRPRGWRCRNPPQSTDLEENFDISTELMHCPTPRSTGCRPSTLVKRFGWQYPVEIAAPARPASPTGLCGTTRPSTARWPTPRRATRRLGGEKCDSSTLYAGEVDDAGLRAACKYLERGKKRTAPSAHYVAILRPGGRRLLITLCPTAPAVTRHGTPPAQPNRFIRPWRRCPWTANVASPIPGAGSAKKSGPGGMRSPSEK